METQTRFDLNAAIAKWQQDLAAQPDLTPIVRRELETHLRDTIAELKARGLNNEESFWLARRRIGPSEQLSEEFAKSDPADVWRERVFWMLLALFAIDLWGIFLSQFNQFWVNPRFLNNRVEDILPIWVLFYLPNWLRNFHIYYAVQIILLLARFVPLIALAFSLGKGRLKFGYSALTYILTSRKRFILAALGAFLACNSVVFLDPMPGRIPAIFFFQFPWAFSLIALIAWLIPKKGVAAGT